MKIHLSKDGQMIICNTSKTAIFGHFIKMEREKREWTQTEFGDRIGITSSVISRIENRTKKFIISKIEFLSSLFQMDIQKVNDLFFADKFAREAHKYKYSDSVFAVAEDTSHYLKLTNTKQGKLEL